MAFQVPDAEELKRIARANHIELTAEELVAHCRKEMTAYKTPRAVQFVDALPKSNVGKILRRELRDRELRS